MALAYIAKGTFDAYHTEDLQPWDLAAGAILVKEAGGQIFNCDGTPYEFMKGSIVAAGTSELGVLTIQMVKDADSSKLTIE